MMNNPFSGLTQRLQGQAGAPMARPVHHTQPEMMRDPQGGQGFVPNPQAGQLKPEHQAVANKIAELEQVVGAVGSASPAGLEMIKLINQLKAQLQRLEGQHAAFAGKSAAQREIGDVGEALQRSKGAEGVMMLPQ